MEAKIKTSTDNKDWENMWLSDLPYKKTTQILQAERRWHQMYSGCAQRNKVYKHGNYFPLTNLDKCLKQ